MSAYHMIRCEILSVQGEPVRGEWAEKSEGLGLLGGTFLESDAVASTAEYHIGDLGEVAVLEDLVLNGGALHQVDVLRRQHSLHSGLSTRATSQEWIPGPTLTASELSGARLCGRAAMPL